MVLCKNHGIFHAAQTKKDVLDPTASEERDVTEVVKGKSVINFTETLVRFENLQLIFDADSNGELVDSNPLL